MKYILIDQSRKREFSCKLKQKAEENCLMTLVLKHPCTNSKPTSG